MIKDFGKIGILSLFFLVLVSPTYTAETTPGDAIKNAKFRGLALYAIISASYYIEVDGVLKYRFSKYWTEQGWSYILLEGADSKDLFGKSIFSKWAIDKKTDLRNGFNLWVHDIDKYESFSNTADIVLRQLFDLAGRLDSLYESKRELMNKYGNKITPDKIAILDKDIRYLSELGNRLIKATKTFFDSARETMINLDIAGARQKALDGLKSFNQDIERIKVMQMKSVDQSINMVVEAMKNLEKATNR